MTVERPLEGVKVGQLDSIELRYCPVPGESLKVYPEAIKAFGLESLRLFYSDFSDSNFKVIKGQFQGLYNLTTLAFEASRIDSLDSGAFEGLAKLRTLVFSGTGIKELRADSFQPLVDLETLELSETKLETLPKDVFQPLSKLKRLKINLRRIKSLHEALFANNKQLKALQLIDNHPGRPEQPLYPSNIFSNLPELRNVSFTGKGIEALPTGLFSSVKLENFEWNLYKCNQSLVCNITISKIFQGSVSLAKFAFSKARVRKLNILFPEDFFKGLSNLTEAKIASAKIPFIPSNIFEGLRALKTVDLSNNLLKVLPDLNTNIKLEKLLANGNRIKRMDGQWLQRNPDLKICQLANNMIEEIPTNLFSYNTKLEWLDLSKNQLTLQPMPNWSSNIKLKHVDFSSNNIQLRTLPGTWTQTSWLQLESLNLSSNSIGPILDVLNLNLKQESVTLDLSNNKITRVDFQRSKFLPASHKRDPTMEVPLVNISDNPINCDCNNVDLAKSLHGQLDAVAQSWFRFVGDSIRCKDPQSLNGQLIKNLQWDSFKCRFQEECPTDCLCYFTPIGEKIDMNCSKSDDLFLPDKPGLQSLSLTVDNLALTSLSSLRNARNYDTVTSLSIAGNRLTKVDVEDLPLALESLQMQDNQVPFLSDHLIEKFKTLKTVSLAGNPYSCSCDSVPLYRFIKENRHLVVDYPNITFNCDRLLKVSKANDTSEFCVDIEGHVVAYVLPLILLALLTLALFTLCLYHKDKILIWLYSNPKTRQFFEDDPMGKDLAYDVFVSYAHPDADFVEGKLVPGLEESDNIKYKCLVHVRDFVPGRNISEQVVEAVDNSRRTLVCLSKHFVASEWAKLEFETAHAKKRVILVLIGDELPSKAEMGHMMHEYISTNTYLDSNDPWFWEKLRYALPHKGVRVPKFMGMRARRRVYSDQMQLINPSLTQIDANRLAQQTNGHSNNQA